MPSSHSCSTVKLSMLHFVGAPIAEFSKPRSPRSEFLIFVYCWREAILRHAAGSESETTAIDPHSAAYFITMYYLDQKISRLDAQRSKIGQNILFRASSQRAEMIVAEKVFEFQDSLDVVRSRCFSHGLKNFTKTIVLLLPW